jgi:transcriptional regulator with XRE-family HTH domain
MESQVARISNPVFGRLLRQWRQERRRSQLALALDAEISARHLSFLETGRALPSREMVLWLAHSLDVPLRERNALLLAAGYAPMYERRPLTAPELEPVQRALDFMLKQQEPYPALVVDGCWNLLSANDAAGRIFGLFQGPVRLPPALANNAMHATFHPDGMRQYIGNWEELSGEMIQRMHREVAAGTDEGSAALLKELLAYPGVPARWATPELATPIPPLVAVRLRKGGLALSFFTTLTTLGTA